MPAVSTLDAVGETPLTGLDAVRPPNGARVLVKWECANPTGSVKDRMADAIERGPLPR